jgi:hypothetical protein
MCEVFPGAVNSIPSHVRISVDVRDTDLGNVGISYLARQFDDCLGVEHAVQVLVQKHLG